MFQIKFFTQLLLIIIASFIFLNTAIQKAHAQSSSTVIVTVQIASPAPIIPLIKNMDQNLVVKKTIEDKDSNIQDYTKQEKSIIRNEAQKLIEQTEDRPIINVNSSSP